MITMRAFAARCADSIKEGKPFLAYRHDHGTGFLTLDGGRETEYTLIRRGGVSAEITCDPVLVEALKKQGAEIIGKRMVHKMPMKSTVKSFRAAIKKMQNDPRTRGSLCVVEYDGNGYEITGGNIGNLLKEMIM